MRNSFLKIWRVCASQTLQVFHFGKLKVLRNGSAEVSAFGNFEQPFRCGQALGNEVNKGVKVMTDSKNILGVTDWTDNTQDLEQQLEATKEKLHFSRTMKERQRLLALQNEVAEDFKRVKELRSKAYEVSLFNQKEIKRLKEAAELLRLESVDISVDSWQLENELKAKRVEVFQLEKAIADDKKASQ
jgi:hypothetical protein